MDQWGLDDTCKYVFDSISNADSYVWNPNELMDDIIGMKNQICMSSAQSGLDSVYSQFNLEESSSSASSMLADYSLAQLFDEAFAALFNRTGPL